MDLYYLVGLNLGNSSEYNSKHHYLSLASQVWRPFLFDHSLISTSLLPSWVIFFGLVFCGIYNRIFKYLEATDCLITEWLNYWCIDPMIWPTHNNHVQRQLTHLLNNWLTDQTTDWRNNCQTDSLSGWMSVLPTNCQTDLLTDLLTDLQTDGPTDSLPHWLTS